MRKVLIFVISVWGHNASAQVSDSLLTSQMARSYKQAVGLRVALNGTADRSINYKYFIAPKIALEGNIGMTYTRGLYYGNIILMRQNALFRSKGLKLNYGLGLSGMYDKQLSYVLGNESKRIIGGATGSFGLEYQFKKSRFLIGSDLRLTSYFISDPSRGGNNFIVKNVAFNLKYILKK